MKNTQHGGAESGGADGDDVDAAAANDAGAAQRPRFFLRRLWDFAIPDFGERHRGAVTFFTALLLIGVAYPLVQAIVVDIGTNGNEILDKPSPLAVISAYVSHSATAATPWRQIGLAALLVLFAASVFVQIYGSFLAYSRFEREFGKPFPSHELITFMATSALATLAVPLLLALLGVISWLSSGDFAPGWQWLTRMNNVVDRLIADIPTLVSIPYPLPLVAVSILTGFAAYWVHRWCHTTRLGWLLLHRNHHMPPHLLTPVAGPVYQTFPLMFLIAIPYGLFNGFATKLFTPEPMILESMLINAAFSLIGPIGHSSALYRVCRRTRWLYYFQAIKGDGVFHYMHHSALPGHEICNIGGGWFNFWDRVFKTYHTPLWDKPPVGLIGQKPLYMNPFRLAFGGLLQILYELRHNRDGRTRIKILFGSSGYTPPRTRSYIFAGEP